MSFNYTTPGVIFDSRDVIERIADIESEIEPPEDWDGSALDPAWIEDTHEREEYVALLKIAEDGADIAPDWEYGETFIADIYFTEYAEDFARDCGMVSENQSWPNNHIDWDRAAQELKYDYSSIEIDGETYWAR